MFTIAQISLARLMRWAPWFYLLGVALLVAVMVAGVGAKGAQRWLSIGGFRFQPSEIMKLVLPLTIAWYLADRSLPPRFFPILVALALVLVPTALILQQPDLGTSLLIAASGLFVLFVAGMGWGYILGAAMLAIAGSWPMWMFVLRDYQTQRILTLLDPEADKLGAGWNIIQSKPAIGSGGWEGKGWTDGTQSHLDILPESHTDFIIAVLSEEFGLRGVLVLMTIYLLILLRGFWIGINARSSFGRMVAGTAHNVIPETAELNGTVRTLDGTVRTEIAMRMERVIRGVTEAHGASYEFTYERGYRPVVNDAAVTAEMVRVVADVCGAGAVVAMRPVMVGEDFSAFQQKAPGNFFFIGIRNEARGIVHPHHHPRFDIDESALETGVKIFAEAARRFNGKR
jgi:hypothetical protein